MWKHRADDWLLAEWLPAELRHLRTTADDAEISGLLWAYQAWQRRFMAGDDGPAASAGWDASAPSAAVPGELGWALTELRRKRTLTPAPFRLRWPLLARLRAWWNAVATESYLRPLIQQQNDYNAALLDLAEALARQRLTSDGAVLAQAMLLAKLAATSRQIAPRLAAQTPPR